MYVSKRELNRKIYQKFLSIVVDIRSFNKFESLTYTKPWAE